MQNNDQQISNIQQGAKKRVALPFHPNIQQGMKQRVASPFQSLRQFVRSFCVVALSLPLLTGCNMNDPMIQEMEAAYATAPQKKVDTLDEKTEKRKEAVSRAVQKYFPPGMQAEEAFKRLRQLKEQGFEISETRNEGARAWPDGELIPYPGEVGKLTYQRRYPKGMSEFLARKQYGTQISLLATKHVVISFRVADGSGVISEVKGNIWASGI